MITYSVNRQPVYRASYDGASPAARLQSEIFERLTELHELKFGSHADLCRRLATLADLSPVAFGLVLHVGAGDTTSVMQSFEDMAEHRGKTRQSLHWEFGREVDKIKFCFPEVAALLVELRHAIDHKEQAKSGSDVLRDCAEGQQ